MMYGKQREILK